VAKSKVDPLDFPFGANVGKPKKAPAGGAHKGKRKLSEAQKATAVYYMKSSRRR
jgi:hypothetical protein